MIQVTSNDDMKQLLSTFVQAFKSLPYVVLLMGLVFYIFAVVGMESFGKIDPSIVEDNPDEVFDEFTNFRTFGSTLFVLIRCSTGEGWQGIMAAAFEHPHGGFIAIPYFVLFVVSCYFLVINLFIAVIMDNFDYITQDKSELSVQHLPQFIEMWTTLDPAGSGTPTCACSSRARVELPRGAGSERLQWKHHTCHAVLDW